MCKYEKRRVFASALTGLVVGATGRMRFKVPGVIVDPNSFLCGSDTLAIIVAKISSTEAPLDIWYLSFSKINFSRFE